MAPYLVVGDEITATLNGSDICVSKIDRRDDPYFASVVHGGKVVATGLFSSLSAARQWCEARAPLTPQGNPE
jgi:hypothetical protein